MILSKQLKELGFEVHQAGNGVEALAKLKDIDVPDLMLIDWNMPEMDGFEFLQAVRSDPSYVDTLIVMVTSEGELGYMQKAMEAGASEYITKPFTADTIKEKLMLLGIGIE